MKKNILIAIISVCLLSIVSSYALAASATFGNPISSSTIEAVFNNISTYLKSIAGVIAVIFIVIGGIMYMLSGGSTEMAERGKKTIIYAMAGLAIVVGASTILNEIKSVLGSGSGTSGGLATIASNVLKLLLSIVGSLAIIAIVIGAIWMFTGAGDQDRYELGKKTVVYAIIGTAIAVGSLIIAQQVANLIGG
jgi:hypothetical protein